MEGVKYDGQDIEQMWREALVEFHKLSGHDPKKFSELSIGDVIGKINQQKELDDKRAAKYGKAKEVLNKTLTCIQTLGSLVAQGASMVCRSSSLAILTSVLQFGKPSLIYHLHLQGVWSVRSLF